MMSLPDVRGELQQGTFWAMQVADETLQRSRTFHLPAEPLVEPAMLQVRCRDPLSLSLSLSPFLKKHPLTFFLVCVLFFTF